MCPDLTAQTHTHLPTYVGRYKEVVKLYIVGSFLSFKERSALIQSIVATRENISTTLTEKEFKKQYSNFS